MRGLRTGHNRKGKPQAAVMGAADGQLYEGWPTPCSYTSAISKTPCCSGPLGFAGFFLLLFQKTRAPERTDVLFWPYSRSHSRRVIHYLTHTTIPQHNLVIQADMKCRPGHPWGLAENRSDVHPLDVQTAVLQSSSQHTGSSQVRFSEGRADDWQKSFVHHASLR